MDRNTILWTLVVFFGATVLFGVIRNATEGESAAVTLGVQALVGLLIVGAIVFVIRRWR
jgi:MYXO-CTERM domain-containing protein